MVGVEVEVWVGVDVGVEVGVVVEVGVGVGVEVVVEVEVVVRIVVGIVVGVEVVVGVGVGVGVEVGVWGLLVPQKGECMHVFKVVGFAKDARVYEPKGGGKLYSRGHVVVFSKSMGEGSPKEFGGGPTKDKDGKERSFGPTEDSVEIECKLWPKERRDAFIEGRVIELRDALKLPDDKLPRCKDTWGGRRCDQYCDAVPHCHQYLSRKEF